MKGSRKTSCEGLANKKELLAKFKQNLKNVFDVSTNREAVDNVINKF